MTSPVSRTSDQSEAPDGWTRHTPYHWSRMIGTEQLDYWPTTRKWRFRNKTKTGDVNAFIESLPPPPPVKAKKIHDAPACIECGGLGELTTGLTIYPGSRSLAKLNFWRCGCGAYVGTHKGTAKALGTCAGPETREARTRAHHAFDPLWKVMVETGVQKGVARPYAYAWLADTLGYERGKCHISWMTVAEADRVIDLCSRTLTLPPLPDDSGTFPAH